MDNRAIGIFDSGVGGITALTDITNNYPNESYIFLADTLNNPYGLKTKSELEKIVAANIKYLEKQNVKLIIIACNTASANSYHINAKVPIIRIIEPTVNLIPKTSKNILVLATKYTIDSNIYQKLIGDRAIGLNCSKFVEIVEKGMMGTDIALKVVSNHLRKFKGKIDTVILGCTHFGLLTNEIISILGDIKIIDSSLSIAPLLKKYIEREATAGSINILTTGKKEDLRIEWFKKPFLLKAITLS